MPRRRAHGPQAGRRPARRRLAFTLIALSGVAGCSLFTTLDGFTTDAPSERDAAEDVAVPASDAAVGPATDAGAPVDADVDADVDTRRWCERQSPAPKVCEDFDDPTEFAPGWRTEPPFATLTRTDLDARSAPYAFLAETSGKRPPAAFLRRTFAGQLEKLVTAFDMRVTQRGQYAEVGYVNFKRAAGEPPLTVYLELGPAYDPVLLMTPSFAPDGGDATDETPLQGVIDFGAWTRVEIELDIEPRHVTVRVDGTVAATKTLPAGLSASESFDVTVGTAYSYGSAEAGWRILFDNFTADWK